MPLYGTLDITANAKALPTLANLDTEAWTLPKAEMLQLLVEVPRSTTDGLLPKAMHPALPSYVILAITKYSESPVGPFNLAVLRLGSRAGAHPRGFLLGAVASTEAAAKELRGRWGLPVEAGEVKFLRRHDRVMGTVSKAGKVVLDCALIDPQPVAGTDVQYINWVTAANAPLDGQTQPMLIQVDPKYTFTTPSSSAPACPACTSSIACANSACGARVRGRHQCRRHLVLEPLSRRALRFRELFLRLLLLQELLEEWDWSEHFAAQPETLRYLNYVADKFDLRRDIQFNSRSPPRTTTRSTRSWDVTLEDGSRFRTRFLITAIGPLSAPTMPRIEGIESFQGPVLPHRALAARAGRLRRQARRRDRHRRHRRADHPDHRQDRRPPHRVPAHARTGARRCTTARSTPRRRCARSRPAIPRCSRAARRRPPASSTRPIRAGPSRSPRGARGVLGEALRRAAASASGRAISATS
jgi:hypothetical protein